MKTGLVLSAAALAAAIVAASVVSSSKADESQYANRDLRGSWGFVGYGMTWQGPPSVQGVPTSPPTEPHPGNLGAGQAAVAVVGRMTFDGDGHGTMQNYHDQMISGPGRLGDAATNFTKNFTYTVYPDGTGSIAGGGADPVEYRFVLVDNKKELDFIRFDAGDVQFRIAKRQ